MKSTSIGIMIKRVSGLEGTKDVTDWESGFIRSIVIRTSNGEKTDALSESQVSIIVRIHNQHFAS